MFKGEDFSSYTDSAYPKKNDTPSDVNMVLKLLQDFVFKKMYVEKKTKNRLKSIFDKNYFQFLEMKIQGYFK